MLDAAPAEGAVFVPAYDRRGSNCILRRPASIIPLRFGNDSFLPHCEAMKKTGKELVILEMPGIGLDIDNPHELEMLVQRDGRHSRAAAAAVVGIRRSDAVRAGKRQCEEARPRCSSLARGELRAIPVRGIRDVIRRRLDRGPDCGGARAGRPAPSRGRHPGASNTRSFPRRRAAWSHWIR